MHKNTTPEINRETLMRLRNKCDLTQEQLATKVGVNKDTTYRWERLVDGKPTVAISTRHHQKIADALGVKVARLYGPPPAVSDEDEERNQSNMLSMRADMMLSQICDTYHLNRKKALEFSITLLHITAAASLGHRRQQINSVKAELNASLERNIAMLPHLAGEFEYGYDAIEGEQLDEEEHAINNCQLFNDNWQTIEEDPVRSNPYADFLQRIIKLMPEEMKDRYTLNWQSDDLPNVEISDRYLAQILNLTEDHTLLPKLKDEYKAGTLKYDDFVELADGFRLLKVLSKPGNKARELIQKETKFSDDPRFQDILKSFRDSLFTDEDAVLKTTIRKETKDAN